MKFIYKGHEYVSETELSKTEGATKDALKQIRKRGKYNDDIIVLPKRMYYKAK